MGSGSSVNARYMGGKSLDKFFKEDKWPVMVDLFERLNMDIAKAFEVFKAFARTDANEDGLVDINECFNHLGGRRTKFTERILYSEPYVDEEGFTKSGLTFKAFLLAVWNYCTLTPAGLARYVFEIYDVDQTELLEKPDVESMFKLLYNTDEVEKEYIDIYRFDEYSVISKEIFCRISNKKKYLIRPAIEYQAKLRSRTGGKRMWEQLTAFRQKELKLQDNQEITLSNALSAIEFSSSNYSSRNKPLTAELRLEERKKTIAADTEMVERELRWQERRLEVEMRNARNTAPDRKMHQAFSILAMHKTMFEEEEYLTTDLEKRCKDRNKLFALFDIAKAEAIAYWEYKDAKDVEVTEGSAADHDARYQDHLKTDEGRAIEEICQLIKVLELAVAAIEEQVAKMKRKPLKKSDKHALLESQMHELQKIYKQLQDPTLSPADYKKRLKHLIERDFTDEHKFVQKNCKKSEIAQANALVYKELCAKLKEKTMHDLREQITAAQEQRRRDYIVKEFEITTNYGSRTTKWEYVLSKEENKYVYMNRDTLAVRHPKTAICEQCDGIFVQHELRCDGCNGPRSAKNLKLYRPLGFRDITLE
jgi:hypothetical protein